MEEASSAIEGDSAAVYVMKKVYLKDLSFESPNAPGIFSGDGLKDLGHKMNINIRVSHIEMENHEYEVAVRLTVHATGADNNSYCLIEVEQAGIFVIKDVSENDLEQYLKVHCPRALYPFARQMVWSIISSGGFPALLLQDFDFDAMHQLNQGRNHVGSARSGST